MPNTFKERYQNYKTSVTNKYKRHATGLSSYIWSLNDIYIKYSIKLNIIKKKKAKLNSKNG